jgi:hypothetical protein
VVRAVDGDRTFLYTSKTGASTIYLMTLSYSAVEELRSDIIITIFFLSTSTDYVLGE